MLLSVANHTDIISRLTRRFFTKFQSILHLYIANIYLSLNKINFMAIFITSRVCVCHFRNPHGCGCWWVECVIMIWYYLKMKKKKWQSIRESVWYRHVRSSFSHPCTSITFYDGYSSFFLHSNNVSFNDPIKRSVDGTHCWRHTHIICHS